jgi:salicylate hydroxylase
MALEGRDVAIVGAGIGGLAAATALAQRRARVVVYERAPRLAEVGAGLQIGPNGVAVLEALGLRDAAEAVASTPQAIELRCGLSGRDVARVPLGAACVARYGRPYWQIHRADLLDVLAAGSREAGAEIRLDAGDHAEIALEGGAVARAPVAIGADGVRSALRAARFGGAAPRFAGHVAWRGLVPAARLPKDLLPRAATVFMGPGRHLVAYPLRGGALWNFVAVEARAAWAEEGWTTPDDPAAPRRAFAGWCREATTLLGAADATFLWGLFDHAPLPEWARGRLALLGDACHPMLPFLAQGAAMAIEDAWVLAECLALRADDLPAGLAAYEDRRRARATRTQRAAARNGRLYHLPTGLVRGAAHVALGLAARAPGGLIARFDWLYGANVVGMEATD